MRLSGHLRVVSLVVGAALLLQGCGSTESPTDPVSIREPETPSGAATVRVVAVGNIACRPGSTVTRRKCRHAATARVAARLNPSMVLTLGDQQYEKGTRRQFARAYARTWGRFLARTRPVLGNHEYETPGARGYHAYFRNQQPGPPGYYRTAVNGWAIYHLNSNCRKVDCLAQARWLHQQMTASPSRCTLLTMHHPRYSSGKLGNFRSVKPFWDVGYRHRADVALAAHNHVYERFRPMNGSGAAPAPSSGIQGFVVGTGGKSLFKLGKRKQGSVYVQNRAYGVLALDLEPGSYRWAFHSIGGRVLDRGSRSCV